LLFVDVESYLYVTVENG